MRKLLKISSTTLVIILIIWGILTLWAEAEGPVRSLELGNSTSEQKALIVYDPDPIYNLDEQVCESFGKVLAQKGLRVRIATVAAFTGMAPNDPSLLDYDLYVFCANTYNWQPDWAVTSFIKNAPIEQKSVVAITLGSGSTQAAQRALEKLIAQKKGKLIGSRSFWLLRPNDETKLEGSNVAICLDKVAVWAPTIGDSLQNISLSQK